MATVRNLSSGPQEWGGAKGKENVPHLSSCAPHQFSTPTMYLSHRGGALSSQKCSLTPTQLNPNFPVGHQALVSFKSSPADSFVHLRLETDEISDAFPKTL